MVKELLHALPGEDIVYYGDSANCPYGNRSLENLIELGTKMLDFCREKECKAIAIACNTLSPIIDKITEGSDTVSMGVIRPAGEYVASLGIKKVGVLATAFTVASGAYDAAIHLHDPSIEVYSQSSPSLASMIEKEADEEDINREIILEVEKLLKKGDVRHILMSCTHYPIVEAQFSRCFPEINFINPARAQANALQKLLKEKGLVTDSKTGSMDICTSGEVSGIVNTCKRLGIDAASSWSPNTCRKLVI